MRYLKGGLNSFVLALEEYIRKNGGTICLNTKCEELLIEGDFIKCVITDKGILAADSVVCNSDYSYSSKTYFINRLSEIGKDRTFDYSCSVFMLYIGLTKKYECLSVHNIYIGPNFKKNIEAAFKGKIPIRSVSIYLLPYAKIDDTMAPPGKDAINVMIRGSQIPGIKILSGMKNLVKKMRDKLIKALQKVNGLEDINDNIEFESYLTPKDFEVKFNSFYGNAFGISHNLTQTAFLRHSNKV